MVDLERCAVAGVEVLTRRAGGGALLLDASMLCGAICLALPDPRAPDDLTESYRWLGDCLVAACHRAGVPAARRVEVDEARADVADLRQRADAVARILLNVCYGALSPHEVAIGSAKLIGIAQVRRRHAALLQFGILLRDQAPLADLLSTPDEATRDELRAELRLRTIGLDSVPDVSPLPRDNPLPHDDSLPLDSARAGLERLPQAGDVTDRAAAEVAAAIAGATPFAP
jgi:lipoate-protein ligase A